MKNKLSIAMSLALIMAMLVTSLALANGTPTISSDFFNYAPGDTVNLLSAGWQAGESVHIFVNDGVGSSWSRNTDVVAGEDGTFTDTFQLPSWFVATYSVTATGATSGIATTTFVDAAAHNVNFETNGLPSGVSITVSGIRTNNGGQTGSYFVTFNSPGPSADTGTLADTAFTYSGFPSSVTSSGQNCTLTSTSPASGFNTGAAGGRTTVTATYNCAPAVQNQTITVTTAAPASAVYGSSFGVTATASSSLPVAITTGGSCSGSGSGSATILMTSGIGTCTVYYNQGGNTSYNPALQVTNSTAAQKATPTVTTWPTASAITYGQALSASTLSGGSASVPGSFGFNAPATTPNAGTYSAAVTFTPIDAANYNTVSGSVNVTVNKKAASVTPNAASKTYGDIDPAFIGTLSGFLAGDGVTAAYSRTAGETVAGNPYTISATLSPAGVLDNYNITYNTANFTITKRDVTWTTNDASKTYGDADPNPLTTGSGSNFVDTVTATYSRVAGETVAGSPYHITATLSAAAGVLDNYNITNNGGNFTITKRDATWTTNPNSKTYGDADPSPLTTGSGNFLATDNVTATYSRASGETVAGSPYHITATLYAAAGVLDNYNITNNGADFIINKANATCTVTGYSVYYDGLEHTATGSCIGVFSGTLSGLDLSGTKHTVVGAWADPWTFTDVTGNYNNTSGTVNDAILAWTLTGFYQPVDMTPNVWNTVKGGSTVPLKFNVYAGLAGENEQTTTDAIKSFAVVKVVCDGTGTDDPITFTTTGGTSLRYDTTGHQFVQNWQTPKGAGICYRVTMTTQDLSTIIAYFKTK